MFTDGGDNLVHDRGIVHCIRGNMRYRDLGSADFILESQKNAMPSIQSGFLTRMIHCFGRIADITRSPTTCTRPVVLHSTVVKHDLLFDYGDTDTNIKKRPTSSPICPTYVD